MLFIYIPLSISTCDNKVISITVLIYSSSDYFNFHRKENEHNPSILIQKDKNMHMHIVVTRSLGKRT